MEVLSLPRVNREEVVVEQPQAWRPPGSEPPDSVLKNDDGGLPEEISSVHSDKNEGNITPGKTLKVEEIDIPKLVTSILSTQNTNGNLKDKILAPFPGSTSVTDSDTRDTHSEQAEKIDLMEEDDDEEVIELEFMSAVEKIHNHTPYCPNCRNKITKVILRRKKTAGTAPSAAGTAPSAAGPPRDKPLDLLGCLSCFSIFVPSGNVLNPFRLFGPKGKRESAQVVGSEHAPGADPAVAPTASTVADGSATVKQGTAFDLFWIFRKRKGDETASNSRGNRVAVSQGYQQPGHITNGVSSKPEYASEIAPIDESLPSNDLAINVGDETENDVESGSDRRGFEPVEIAKCIVYGGLMESISSLSVVSSAASSGASTVNIFGLGLATLMSSIFVFGHHLWDMKNEEFKQDSGEHQTDRYQECLGKRGHYFLHATLAILSFLVFGLVPPVVYAFAFYESDNRDYKLLAVAAASLPCIIILAVGQAYIKRTQKASGYVMVVMYYVSTAVAASGVAYAAGDLIRIVMAKLGWFGATGTPAAAGSATPAWASY